METLCLDQSNVTMSLTDEGYLRGEAVVTRTGVFVYKMPDGTISRQLRHPDDVLAPESLATIKQIPVTLEHPPVMLNSDNAKKYSVGYTGDVYYSNDQGHVIVNFTITDKDAVEAVKKGHTRQLSLGYYQQMKDESGIYNGEPYTHRQTNIRYNHLALVEVARAGNAATIRLDGAAYQLSKEEAATVADDNKRLDSVVYNGISYQVPPEIRVAMDSINKELAEAKDGMGGLKKEMDMAKAKYDELKAKYDEMMKKEKNNDSAIAEKVNAGIVSRLGLIAKASKVCDTKGFEAKDDKSIMLEAIKAKHPNFDAKDKSDDYIAARFDAMIEAVESGAQVPGSIAGQRKNNDGAAIKPVAALTFDTWAAQARA